MFDFRLIPLQIASHISHIDKSRWHFAKIFYFHIFKNYIHLFDETHEVMMEEIKNVKYGCTEQQMVKNQFILVHNIQWIGLHAYEQFDNIIILLEAHIKLPFVFNIWFAILSQSLHTLYKKTIKNKTIIYLVSLFHFQRQLPFIK